MAISAGWMYHIGAVINLKTQEMQGKELTGEEMHAVTESFYKDLGPHLSGPFSLWFDYVKAIPYESDIQKFPERVIELVARPLYSMNREILPRIDCKKKSILIGSWARGNGLPFRYLAVSDSPDKTVTHVFPQIDFRDGAGWVTVDATLPENKIGQGFNVTYAAELQK